MMLCFYDAAISIRLPAVISRQHMLRAMPLPFMFASAATLCHAAMLIRLCHTLAAADGAVDAATLRAAAEHDNVTSSLPRHMLSWLNAR